MTKLVLVGGGHAHVEVLRRLALHRPPHTHVTVILDTPVAVYSGMVPGFVAGRYRLDEIGINVLPLARRAGANVVLARAVRVDSSARYVHVAELPPVPYDLASFDVGSTVAGAKLPGIAAHALPTRPIGQFVLRVEALVEGARSRRCQEFRVVVAGGGSAGVELAFTIWQRLYGEGNSSVRVTLVTDARELLAGFPNGLAARVHRHADRRDIAIVPGRRIVGADSARLLLDDGATLPCDGLVWATGAAGHPLFAQSDLPTDARGFVQTRGTLQVAGADDLFAVGDCAAMLDHPALPKAGVYAVRQGPYLAANLLATLSGRRLRRYHPQTDFLTLLTLGDGAALGAKWGFSFEGRWVGVLKDRIDRRFVRRFQVL